VSICWEAHQQFSIRAAEARAADASARVHDVRADVRMLVDALDRMALVHRAMWELVAPRRDISEEELAAKVREIDLRDGKLDGRLRPEVRRCPKCQRTMQRRHIVCLSCGAEDTNPRRPRRDPHAHSRTATKPTSMNWPPAVCVQCTARTLSPTRNARAASGGKGRKPYDVR